MSLPYNIVIEQGADFQLVLTIADDDGTPKDLTDHIANSQMRKTYKSSNYVDITAEITNEVYGELTMFLPASITSTLKAGRYLYDLELVSPQGIITRVIEGIATVTPGVTR